VHNHGLFLKNNFVEREKNLINEENLDRLEKEIQIYAPFIRATPY